MQLSGKEVTRGTRKKIPKQRFSNLLISDRPPGPKKQEEVRDGDARGREEKAISLPAWPAFPPLCLCLLSLPWLRRPHLVWAEHSAAPAGPWRTPGQHQGGSPQRGWKHLMRAEQEMAQNCSQRDCKYLGRCEEQWVNPRHHLSRCCNGQHHSLVGGSVHSSFWVFKCLEELLMSLVLLEMTS